jgi:hypothetical protein
MLVGSHGLNGASSSHRAPDQPFAGYLPLVRSRVAARPPAMGLANNLLRIGVGRAAQVFLAWAGGAAALAKGPKGLQYWQFCAYNQRLSEFSWGSPRFV